jgi:hypothetical protein
MIYGGYGSNVNTKNVILMPHGHNRVQSHFSEIRRQHEGPKPNVLFSKILPLEPVNAITHKIDMHVHVLSWLDTVSLVSRQLLPRHPKRRILKIQEDVFLRFSSIGLVQQMARGDSEHDVGSLSMHNRDDNFIDSLRSHFGIKHKILPAFMVTYPPQKISSLFRAKMFVISMFRMWKKFIKPNDILFWNLDIAFSTNLRMHFLFFFL